MPVIGAADESTREAITGALAKDPAIMAAHPEAASRLARRHGTQATEVAALGKKLDLLRPLVPGRPFLEAEVAWAVRHELALSVDDVLSRRLRLSPELGDERGAAADRVASIMARELGWDERECERQRDAYVEGASREYAVPGRA
jgi:glycerol-3-phosphate dehydrogenase